MPWRPDSSDQRERFVEVLAASVVEVLLEWTSTNVLRNLAPAASIRQEANGAVLRAYRNGPIENLHAGVWSLGSEVPGFVRLYTEDIRRVGRRAADDVATHLAAREDAEGGELVRIALASASPYDWSLMDETSAVAYLGMPDMGSLERKLRLLAERYPGVYGPLGEPSGNAAV